ncbi:predicted protein [Naegleria gruberi]|uniref:Predicted protein n=1 Tax=Naegleria gruberi TaxID=5762 RepID=D2VWN1_NAEGR|nr:uncharacterized protein NAEGRDRAFT_73440 [Naegleria gruberi]EFC38724.1 predicted protein [Naegleria gruberi]|eukprot:XP_002671468.1 predicted protein [Naegleria gruberi strain NEG-M]
MNNYNQDKLSRRKDRSTVEEEEINSTSRLNQGVKQPVYLTHVEEMEDNDELKGNPMQYMTAGAMAGLVEHAVMYPIDTIKTYVQSSNQGIFKSIKSIGGIRNFYSGLTVVLYGALPSHAFYFTTYEAVKNILQGRQTQYVNDWSVSALAGIAATIAHDGIATPTDVIKQHMQLKGHVQNYNLMSATREIYATRGLRAFFVSLPTTILMNIPYTSFHFVTYEYMKKKLFDHHDHDHHDHDHHHDDHDHDHDEWKHVKHFMAGGAAGAVGGLVSNPFDVVKTLLQVGQADTVKEAISLLRKEEGGLLKNLFRGSIPRVVYFTPSAAVTWTTYEYIKYVFRWYNTNNNQNK